MSKGENKCINRDAIRVKVDMNAGNIKSYTKRRNKGWKRSIILNKENQVRKGKLEEEIGLL